MLTLLVGRGLRRGELLALTMRSVQLREDHWVVADLHGKAGRIRTVPIPVWVKEAIDGWTSTSGITEGRIFRSINKAGKIWGDGMTPKVIWGIVKRAAKTANLRKLARTTCVALVPGSAILPVANSIRSSFFSGMYRSRLLNAISGAQAPTAMTSLEAGGHS
jgi:integrase